MTKKTGLFRKLPVVWGAIEKKKIDEEVVRLAIEDNVF